MNVNGFLNEIKQKGEILITSLLRFVYILLGKYCSLEVENSVKNSNVSFVIFQMILQWTDLPGQD